MENNGIRDNGRPPLIYTLNLYFMMLSLSFTVTSVGPLVPTFIKHFGLSLSEGGLVTLVQGIGGTLGTLLGATVSDRIGKPRFIKITMFMAMAALAGIALSSIYVAVLVFLFIMGGFIRLCDATINAWVSELYKKNRERFVTLLHVFFGAGAVAGPFLAVGVINAGLGWNYVFAILCGFGSVFLVMFLFMGKSGGGYAIKRGNAANAIRMGEFIKIKRLIPIYLASMLQAGHFVGTATWTPTYMQDILKTSVVLSGIPISAFWGGITLGRLITSTFAGKVDARKMLIGTNIAAGLLTLAAFLVNNPVAFIAIYCVVGMMSGALLPFSVAIVSDWYPRNTGTASSLISTFGAAGQMLFPWILGVIAENIGFMTAMYMLAGFPVAAGLMFTLIKYKRGVEAPEEALEAAVAEGGA